MPADPERQFVKLIFDVSKKYASWDPEVPIDVGDYGRITAGRSGLFFWRRKGTFLKEGNIYANGQAEKFGITLPHEHGSQGEEGGVAWFVSGNATKIDFDASISSTAPALAKCSVKAGFHFDSSPAAILAMQNDTIWTINPPGSLRLLAKEPSMSNRVIVSEVHRCSSYIRALTSANSRDLYLGVSAEPSTASPAKGKARVEARWITSSTSGNFRSKVDAKGDRSFCPLFRLVTFRETAVTTGMRGPQEVDVGQPLPDAVPPWDVAPVTKEPRRTETSSQRSKSWSRFRRTTQTSRGREKRRSIAQTVDSV